MIVVEFADTAIRRKCCDLSRMQKLWGAGTARRISHRLQQLEAMESMADLSFLPLDWRSVDDGFELVVDESVTLQLQVAESSARVEGMTTVVVRGVSSTTTEGRL